MYKLIIRTENFSKEKILESAAITQYKGGEVGFIDNSDSIVLDASQEGMTHCTFFSEVRILIQHVAIDLNRLSDYKILWAMIWQGDEEDDFVLLATNDYVRELQQTNK